MIIITSPQARINIINVQYKAVYGFNKYCLPVIIELIKELMRR